jgi:hypothetical protein
MTASGNIVYVLGGHDGANATLSSVERAVVAPDKSLSAWQFSSSLNVPRTLTTAVATASHVYAIGGAQNATLIGLEIASVEYATIQPDGSLSPWVFTSSLSAGRANAVAMVHGDVLYVLGGYGNGQLKTIERAEIRPDGSLSSWAVLSSQLPIPLERPAAAIVGETMLALGGYSSSAGGIINLTFYAPILPNGNLGAWVQGPSMTSPRYHLSAAVVQEQLFALAGYNDGQSMAWATIEKSTVDSAGPGPWADGPILKEPRAGLGAAVSNGNIYVAGGTHGLFAPPWFMTATVEKLTVINSLTLTNLSPAKIWVGLANSDDMGTRFDLKAEVYRKDVLIATGQSNNVPGGSSGFNKALLDSISLTLPAPVFFDAGDFLSIKLSVRNTCSGKTHNSGRARLWYNDVAANSRFDATINGATNDYFPRDASSLGLTPGPGPKKTIDVFVDSKQPCPNRPFTPFSTWSITLP